MNDNDIILCKEYIVVLSLTLPYHTGQTFYRLTLRPLAGPMRIPELTVRLQNPQL